MTRDKEQAELHRLHAKAMQLGVRDVRVYRVEYSDKGADEDAMHRPMISAEVFMQQDEEITLEVHKVVQEIVRIGTLGQRVNSIPVIRKALIDTIRVSQIKIGPPQSRANT